MTIDEALGLDGVGKKHEMNPWELMHIWEISLLPDNLN